MAPHSTVVVAVDRIGCDGHGICAELFPERIDLDDWGYPIISPEPVPPALMDHARRAVEMCPVLALRLRRVPAPTGVPVTSPRGRPR
jgi:ferredoxin